MESSRPTRRRWFQFSLRTFLVVITLVGLGCAWVGMQLEQKRRHERAVNEIVKLGGAVQLMDAEEVPAWKAWLFGSYAVTPVYLHLVGTEATDSLLSQVQGMNLVVLDLRSSEVTDAGITHLKELSRLRKMFLSNTHITDVGLLHLEGLTSLRLFSLGNTQVTDAGLTHLKGLTSLEQLDLGNTQVTDEGLTHLKGLTSLKTFILENTQVTQAGIDSLQKAIPGCRIYY